MNVQSSVAPMMDWTDNHYRTLARHISRHAWLYTEMVVADTINYQKDNLVSICRLVRVAECLALSVVMRISILSSASVAHF